MLLKKERKGLRRNEKIHTCNFGMELRNSLNKCSWMPMQQCSKQNF